MAVYKKEDGRAKPWIAEYRDHDGKKRSPGFRTKKAADAYYRTTKDELELGIHSARNHGVTVGVLFDAFLDHSELRRRKNEITGATLYNWTKSIENHLRPELGKIRLAVLTSERCQEFCDKLTLSGRVPTMLVARTVLTLALKFAVRKKLGGIRRSPLTDEPLGSAPPRKRIRVPTREQIDHLLLSVTQPRAKGDDAKGRLYRIAIVMLGYFAGLRTGEMAGLQWPMINFDTGWLSIEHSHSKYDGLKGPKTAAGLRRIKMNQWVGRALLAIFEAWDRPATGYVLRSYKTKSQNSITSQHIVTGYFKTAMRNAGLLDENGKTLLTPHSLRHMYASRLHEERVSTKAISVSMGHSSPSITLDTYTHLFNDNAEVAVAVDQIGDQYRVLLDSPRRHMGDINREAVEDIK